MAFKPSKKRHRHIVGAELNLTPIMNVFVIIIPFLLLAAVFAKTAIIDIYLPQEREAQAKSDKSQPSENLGILAVQVSSRGFMLGGIGNGAFIPKNGGAYDYEALSKELVKVKERHPKNEEVIILLEPDLSYDIVVQVMDSARDATVTRDGKQTIYTLFPVVSLGENR
ncbi:MAG: biopolymer transporter ExbD [Deltaproteobacteria bacterium]|nr:biopolymer transporter ExbD [Deltaproteobacteria bacterium]